MGRLRRADRPGQRPPDPGAGYASDPRPVDGDDINFAVANECTPRSSGASSAQALGEAQAGDGSLIRDLVDGGYGRNDDGTYGNGLDLYFTIGASEQRYPRDLGFYFDRGDDAWGTFDH